MNKQLRSLARVLLVLHPLFADASPAPSSPGKASSKESTYAQLKVPLFSDQARNVPVARVESEYITLADLLDAFGSGHGESASGGKSSPKDFKAVIDRLIDLRLVLLEARAMGLDELPEVVKAIEDYRKVAASEMLRENVIKDVVADPAEVDLVFRGLVKQWKVRSLMFPKEEDVKAAAALLQSGKSFGEVAKQALADKKAQGNEAAEFLGADAFLPEVLAVLNTLFVGDTSGAFKVGDGFVLLHLDDIRFPEDSGARARAEFSVLERAQERALADTLRELTKKYATINQKLLDKIDMDGSTAKFAAALKDQRAVAKIQGEAPITVAQVADEVQRKFFHGAQVAVRDKRANDQVHAMFDKLLKQRLILKEAAQQKLSQTEEFERRVAQFERSSLFSTFVNKAVTPELRVSEEEIQKYYEDHKADFSSPEFVKLHSLGFATLKDAESAVAKLKAGTDFKWLKANAPGQLEEGKRWVDFDGNTLSMRVLDPDVVRALGGAKAGDYRIASRPQRGSYVLFVKERIAPKPQAYAGTRDVIAKKLYQQKVEDSIKGWIAKLRKAQRIEIYLTQIGS